MYVEAVIGVIVLIVLFFILPLFMWLLEILNKYKQYDDLMRRKNNLESENKRLNSEHTELKNRYENLRGEVIYLDKTLKRYTNKNKKLQCELREKDEQEQILKKENKKLKNLKDLYEFWYPTNTEIIPQDEQYEKIKDLIKQKKNVFITGGAGTGKSYILQKLKQIYKDNFYLTAYTGIAASNIGGVTLHSFCDMGYAEEPPIITIMKILKNNDKKILRETIQKTKMIAIDEISMCSAYLLEYVDEVLRGVRRSILPFGGVQIIAVGDFMQLPPVVDKKRIAHI